MTLLTGIIIMALTTPAQPAPTSLTLSPSDQWMVRGKQASNKLPTLLEAMKRGPSHPQFADAACAIKLEMAFAAHDVSVPHVPGGAPVVEKTANGTSFSIIMNEHGEAPFVLQYFYPDGAMNEPPMPRIASLPKGWNLLFMKPGVIAMTTPPTDSSCLFIFSISDPFASVAGSST